MWTPGYSVYSTDYNPILSLLASSVWFPVSLWHASILFLSTSLLSGTTKCFSLSCLAPALESTVSPKSPSSFNWKMVFRNQDLSSGYVRCYWNIISCRPSQHTKLGDICMYIYTYTHTFLYLTAYILNPRVHPDTSNSNTDHCIFSIFFMCNFFLSENSVSNDPYWLVCSVPTYTYNSYRIANPYSCTNKRTVQWFLFLAL